MASTPEPAISRIIPGKKIASTMLPPSLFVNDATKIQANSVAVNPLDAFT